MSQTSRISKNNTVVLDNRDGSKSCILHKTEIIRWWPSDRKIRVDTGGWFTTTTRTLLAQCFNEWQLPFRAAFTAKGNAIENHVTGESHAFSKDDLCYATY